MTLPLFSFIAAMAVLMSYLVAYRVMGWRWLDRPNGRSAHRQATPLGGGAGVVTGAIVPMVYILLSGAGADEASRIAILIGLGLVIALIGLVDDLRDISPGVKFFLIGLVCLAGAAFLYPVSSFALDHGQVHLPVVLAVAGTALWLFVMANGVNFMDGCDSLIVLSAIAGVLMLAFLSLSAGNAIAALLAISPVLGLLGFAPLNWSPARMFLGDSGSLFIGFWLGGTALFYIHDGPPGAIYASVLIFMPWLSDVLLTMAWRLAKGRPLMQAHNDHLYQLLLRRGLSHGQVAALLTAQVLACGLLAWIMRSSATSELLTLAAVAALSIIVHWQARTHLAPGNKAAG